MEEEHVEVDRKEHLELQVPRESGLSRTLQQNCSELKPAVEQQHEPAGRK